MPDIITITGFVGSKPNHLTTSQGLDITSFRVGSSSRRFDRGRNEWVDAGTNWYTVTAFRALAVHLADSIDIGQPVVVTGRLRVRAWESGERSGTAIEIDADAVGHDLSWGTTRFTRTVTSSQRQPAASAGEQGSAPGGTGLDAPQEWTRPAPDETSDAVPF